MNMNVIFKSFRFALILIFLVGNACDKLSVDELQPKKESKVITIRATTSIAAYASLENILRSDKPSTVEILSQPERGSVSLFAGRLLQFQPHDNAKIGDEQFNIAIDAAQYVVNLQVVANTNCESVANFDQLSVKLNTPTELNVLANDPIACSTNQVTMAIEIAPLSGQIVIDGKKVIYTPNPGFRGADKFVYKVTDLRTSAVAYASALVTVGQETPTPCNFMITDDFLETTVNVEGSINPAANDLLCKSDTGQVRLAVAVAPKHGVVRFENAGLSLFYAPEKDFLGKDSLILRVCDPSGGCKQSKLYINVKPSKNGGGTPGSGACNFMVNDDGITTAVNMEVGINPAVNDDICVSAGNRIEISIATMPQNGTARIENNGLSLFYLPKTNYIGLDSMTINVCRAPSDCKISKVSITVIRR
jgi:hypothetical protein